MNFTFPSIFANQVNTLQLGGITRLEFNERTQERPEGPTVDHLRAALILPDGVMIELRDLLIKIFPKKGEGN